MKLLGSTENKKTKDKNDENVLHLEIREVVVAHCDIVNNDYSRALYTFFPNKPFGRLLEVPPTNHIFLKTCNSECDEIKEFYTDQNSQQLEIEQWWLNEDYKNEIFNWTQR